MAILDVRVQSEKIDAIQFNDDGYIVVHHPPNQLAFEDKNDFWFGFEKDDIDSIILALQKAKELL